MGKLVGDSEFDVILSAGFLIDQSLNLLAPGGCVIELRKRSVLAKEEKEGRRPDLRYFT